MKSHIDTRRKIKNIGKLADFEELLAAGIFTDEEKQIMRMHYLKGQTFGYIGDILGYSEAAIKRKHLKILDKIVMII